MIFKWITWIFLVLFGAMVSEAIVCTPRTCDMVRCGVQEDDCSYDQIYDPKGGSCGCCGVCITQLGEGASCGRIKERGGPPPTSKCASGLTCDPKSNKCVRACQDSDFEDSSY